MYTAQGGSARHDSPDHLEVQIRADAAAKPNDLREITGTLASGHLSQMRDVDSYGSFAEGNSNPVHDGPELLGLGREGKRRLLSTRDEVLVDGSLGNFGTDPKPQHTGVLCKPLRKI